jgi:ABC transporter DrrB family efflux protein
MSPTRTATIARRVLWQLRRDPRTVALLLVVPCVLLGLLRWMFDADVALFDRIAGPMVGLFPFIIMFLVTSISMLRERTGGTLERLMAMPVAKLDLLVGYGIAFAIAAIAQALAASGVAFGLLDVPIAGSVAMVIALAIGNAVLGMSLGLFTSAFARTEFQAVQFMPALVFPQLLLCGLFVPVDELPDGLRQVAKCLPLHWSFDALSRTVVLGQGLGTTEVARDCALIVAGSIAFLALGAVTLRRRTD